MTMSKLSFRARALDASKAMLLYFAEELPDLPEASINRAVPQMPTGMEKDEESEHHLQRAISARQKYGETPEAVIPVPEVQECTETYYWLYSDNYRMPRSLIHVQPFSMDQDIPDYDMDMEDEGWFQEHKKKSDVPLSRLQFEEMMDRLEKGSGQQSLSLKEARMLLKEDDDLITAVYEYWLAKRQRTGHPLIPMMKQDKGMSTSAASANPYIAFRKRTEKMQTRKNRKNDESSYEKMLKLRRDLTRSVTLLEMVKRREKLKRENLHLTIEILEKRYQVQDFDGRVLNSVSSQKAVRPVFTPLSSNFVSKKEETTPKQEKRAYKKRKRKESVVGEVQALSSIGELASEGSLEAGPALRGSCSPTLWEDSDVKSPFPFRRKSSSLSYHAPLPLPVSDASVPRDKCHRYCLTSLQHPKQRCIGFARRRVGRGGRVHLDRAYTSLDEYWADLGFSICDNSKNGFISNEFLQEIRNEWLHFKPEKQSASRSPSPGGDSLEPNFVIPCDVTCTDSDLFTEPLHMDLTVLPLSLSCGPVLCDADDGADQDKEKAEGEEERKGSGGLRDGGKLPEVERQPTLNGPATVDMTESSSYSIPVVTPQLPDVILSHSVPSSKPLASITARLPDCKPLAFIPSDQKLVKSEVSSGGNNENSSVRLCEATLPMEVT